VDRWVIFLGCHVCVQSVPVVDLRTWTWDQAARLRWLLLDEESETALALSADIDGLFADVPPPVRERFTLLGCAPAGRLRAALDAIGTEAAWLGNMHVLALHTSDRRCDDPSCGCAARLFDLEVVGFRPTATGAGLVDVELEGERHDGDEHPDQRPDADGFRLSADDELGECQDVRGVFRPPTPAPPRPVTLVGCQSQPWLREAMHSANRQPGEPFSAAHRRYLRAQVHAVDAGGTAVPLPGGLLAGSVTASRDSAVGSGLHDIDIASAGLSWHPLPTRVREIWDRWYAGAPTDRNEWARYDSFLRRHWLLCAKADHRRVSTPDPPAGATYDLDGSFVTDLVAFHCALGEAVNGPGGYLGDDLDALDDALRHGHGATTPFRLVWHDAEVARAHLIPGHGRRGWTPTPTLDDLLSWLGARSVDVELR
jgi:hypothetical protein